MIDQLNNDMITYYVATKRKPNISLDLVIASILKKSANEKKLQEHPAGSRFNDPA